MTFEYLKYIKPLREQRVARGLTVKGEQRRNKVRAQLRGLSGKRYHAAYMKLRRMEAA